MFTIFTKKDLNAFFNSNRFEQKLKQEMLADQVVMQVGIKPSPQQEINHQIKYYHDDEYNNYLYENHPDLWKYRRFGSLARTSYYHDGKLHTKYVRLKKRNASFIRVDDTRE